MDKNIKKYYVLSERMIICRASNLGCCIPWKKPQRHPGKRDHP